MTQTRYRNDRNIGCKQNDEDVAHGQLEEKRKKEKREKKRKRSASFPKCWIYNINFRDGQVARLMAL